MDTPDPGARELLRRVSAEHPCVVCGKPDWCLFAPDGTVAICQRVESPMRCGDAGWLHRLTEPGPNPPRTKGTARKPSGLGRDWAAEATALAANLTPDRRAELAALLRLPADALGALPLLGYSPADALGPCYVFPEAAPDSAVIGLNRRFVTPPRDGHGKRMLPGGRRGLTLPDGWRDRPGPVYVVEGPTDALAMTAAGLAAVGRPSNSGGVALLADLLGGLSPGREIVVLGENDARPDGAWPGRDGAASVAQRLTARLGRRVLRAMPPDGAKDVRDWLTADGWGETPWPERGAGLADALSAGTVGGPADGPAGAGPDGQAGAPTVLVGTDEYRVNAEATDALAVEPDLYQRAGMLVQVVAQHPCGQGPGAAVRRPAGSPIVRDLPPALLRERLTRCARWVQECGDDLKPVHPPGWCVQAVHARGDWPSVRRLEAVVTHPVLLPDGSILSAAGYHPDPGLLVWIPPALSVAVPDRPTREDVAVAVGVLLDVVADFPFERPEHRAAWVASLLTPLAWFAFDGPAPLFLIDKNVRGAGAGLLADVVALTVNGRRFSVMTYTNDREELRKRITSLAAEGERLVLLDNLAGAVGCDVLDAALTSGWWKDRLLGTNQVYDGPLHVCWYGTGNNVQLHADTARRVCHVRMETAEERPELRTGFKYPDLRGHVRADRGRLLSAALTVLRGWVVAGRPAQRLQPWGSFEGWSGVVREAVAFAGLPDPGLTRMALQTAADRDAGAMAALLSALEAMDPHRQGVTTAEIIERLRRPPDPAPGWYADLQAAVEDLCCRLDGRLLGYRFRHFQRRNFGGRMLDKKDAPHGTSRWVVADSGPGWARPADAHHRHHANPADPPSGASCDGGDGGHGGDASAQPGPPRNGTTPRARYRSDDRPHEVRR
jgi:hypothetical protein